MIKSVIKEIIIMLLLCVAIILLVGILFYDYIPTNRIVPTKEAYETPENIKQELNETIVELNTTRSELYEVTDADLNLYKRSSIYKPGKANPFELEPSKDENANTNTNTNSNGNTNTDNNGNVSSGNKDTNQGSTQTFFNDTK